LHLVYVSEPFAPFREEGLLTRASENGFGTPPCTRNVVQSSDDAACTPSHQCLEFTGMILVFGPFLILFGLVWYTGMRKWYGTSLISFRWAV
jgi:hypothetical protein